MKATGIVRRIDELGRVVIPKEIRRTLRIRESDPLEIFTDHEGEVILKKYSPLGELVEHAEHCAGSLAVVSGCGVVITDRDHVVAGAGGRKEMIGKAVTADMEEVINSRKVIMGKDKPVAVVDGDSAGSQTVVPILSEGDAIGAVVLSAKSEGTKLGETEYKMAMVAAGFLGKQNEIA